MNRKGRKGRKGRRSIPIFKIYQDLGCHCERNIMERSHSVSKGLMLHSAALYKALRAWVGLTQ